MINMYLFHGAKRCLIKKMIMFLVNENIKLIEKKEN